MLLCSELCWLLMSLKYTTIVHVKCVAVHVNGSKWVLIHVFRPITKARQQASCPLWFCLDCTSREHIPLHVQADPEWLALFLSDPNGRSKNATQHTLLALMGLH